MELCDNMHERGLELFEQGKGLKGKKSVVDGVLIFTEEKLNASFYTWKSESKKTLAKKRRLENSAEEEEEKPRKKVKTTSKLVDEVIKGRERIELQERDIKILREVMIHTPILLHPTHHCSNRGLSS